MLIFVALISSVSATTVPKEAFDEVYDQLVVSNDNYNELSTKYDALVILYDEQTTAENPLQSAYNEVYSQLETSNGSLVTSNKTIKTLQGALKTSSDNLTDSNKLLKKSLEKKNILTINMAVIDFNFIYSASYGRELIFNTIIYGGINFSPTALKGINVGLIYYF